MVVEEEIVQVLDWPVCSPDPSQYVEDFGIDPEVLLSLSLRILSAKSVVKRKSTIAKG